jgi:prevent-host-death family protein
MCYSGRVERIGIRELRNDTSQVVRRAKAGERIIVTVDGVPAAELGPIGAALEARTIDDLIVTGRLLGRQSAAPPRPAQPIPVAGGRTTGQILDDLRAR